MRRTITGLPSQMRGMGVAGWMITAVVLVAFITFGTKTVPAMVEYNTIQGVIKSSMDDPKLGLMSPGELGMAIDRRFNINGIRDISASDFEITKEAGRMVVKVDYEVRTNLVANIDVVMVFKEDFEESIR